MYFNPAAALVHKAKGHYSNLFWDINLREFMLGAKPIFSTRKKALLNAVMFGLHISLLFYGFGQLNRGFFSPQTRQSVNSLSE